MPADVTLKTKNKSFKANRLILSAASPFLRDLLMSNPCEHEDATLFITDTPDNVMELLLNYMSQGEISVNESDRDRVLEAAHNLGMAIPSSESTRRKEEARDEETAPTRTRKSKPNKLRLSSQEEREEMKEMGMGSLLAAINEQPPVNLEQVFQVPEVHRPTLASAADDDIAASDDEDKLVIDEESQPLNLSINHPSPAAQNLDFLKTILLRKQFANLFKTNSELGDAEETENKDPGVSMATSMGLNIFPQSQLLPSLPLQNYFLPCTATGGQVAPPAIPQETNKEKNKLPRTTFTSEQVVSNGKQSVKCDVCGKVLKDPSSKYRHNKIHTGERPHECSHCGK